MSATLQPRARHLALLSTLIAAALLLGACATNKQDQPARLIKLRNQVPIARVWHTRLRREAPQLRLGLDVAVVGSRLFAADHGGQVEAFDLNTGRRVWRTALKVALSAGPGAGAGLVVVGGSKGWVVALSQVDGKERWRRRINTEIVSAPAVGDDFVVVRGVDGRMEALSTAQGNDAWIVNQEVPRLSLRGASRPILVGDLAICGFDNGHVVAVDRGNGTTAWNAVVDEPKGSSELQRLIDVDAPVVSVGDDLYAAAYQGRVMRLARDSGRSVWTHDLSSYRGLTVDGNAVYVSSSEGTLLRLNRETGAVEWQQKVLANRQLSAPVMYGGRVVVGDLQGFLHWFDPATGKYLARVSAGKLLISATPLVAGDLLLVITDRGDLSAFRAPRAAGANAATAAALSVVPGMPSAFGVPARP